MVISDELNRVITELKAAQNENPVFEAHLIFRHYLNMSAIDLVLNSKKEISIEICDKINNALRRRINKEPLQYILNSQEFMGLEFYVDENVLIPRADTECLVEHILNHFMNKSFTGLDIGTGSGCIAISLAHYNKQGFMRGLDISQKAVEIAKKNAEQNRVDKRTAFEVGDIFNTVLFGRYDLIVSNPPYIKSSHIPTLMEEVEKHEPHLALDGGDDGLDYYRFIVKLAPSLLNKGGMLAFEVGHDQADEVVTLLKNQNFKQIEVINDLCGIKRVVSGII